MKKIILVVALFVATSATANADFVLGGPPGRDGSIRQEGGQVYQWDDGMAENSIGVNAPNISFGWMTQFDIVAGAEVINSISVAFGTNGNNINGLTATAYLWSDPNGDSNPNDAVVLASAAGTVSGAPAAPPQLNNFVDFALPETFVGNAGTSFFVGVILNNMPGTNFPGAIDQSGDQTTLNRTWATFNNTGGTIDPNNLAAASSNLTDLNTIAGLGGRWLIRADGIPIPEPGSAMLLLGLTGLVSLVRRRR